MLLLSMLSRNEILLPNLNDTKSWAGYAPTISVILMVWIPDLLHFIIYLLRKLSRFGFAVIFICVDINSFFKLLDVKIVMT